MKISIIHPTRHRHMQAIETRSNWLSRSDNGSEIEYIFSTDSDDDFPLPSLVSDNKSAIEAINNASKVATGNLFIVVSDDFDCEDGWDSRLLSELDGKSDFVVKTKDGIQKTLITLPILDRAYYNRFRYIYNPEYVHMGCDVELTAVGLMLGRVINSELMFRHRHYTTGLTLKDAINDKNDKTYQHGEQVLARHLLNNFGIKKPAMEYQQIVWH